MKKFIIIVLSVFGIYLIVMASLLVSVSKVSWLRREADDHMRHVLTENEKAYAVYEQDGKEVIMSLSSGNVGELFNALTRTGLTHKFFLPAKSDDEHVTVTFSDGAVIEIYDIGGEKNDKVAFKYKYKGKSGCYTLEGYSTYNRIASCISEEGFGSGGNKIVDKIPEE